MVSPADDYNWHLLHAAYRAGIDTMRTQLAEAQRDAERWRFFRQASIQPIADDHPFTILAERLNFGKASADDVDAAIDNAAKGDNHRSGG